MIDEFASNGVREPRPRHVFEALEGLTRRAGRDMRRLTEPFADGIRGSHGRILSLVDDGGTRPTVLADGAWITKQAMGARIRELEDRGWVSVDPDPSDGRAVLVRLTPEGRRIRDRAGQAIAAMEHSWAQAVGPERYAVFRAVLDELGAGHLPAAVTQRGR